MIQFVFNGLPKFECWWIVIEENQERELCVDNPGKGVDVQIRSSVRTMVEVWAGDTEIRAAKKDGRLELSGSPVLIRTLASWLRTSKLAHIRPHPDSLRT